MSNNNTINNPTNYILGSNVDGARVTLGSGSKGNKAVINVKMDSVLGNPNNSIRGHVYLYGYSGTWDGSHLMVFVSNDNINWNPNAILDKHLWHPTAPNEPPRYIDCGYVNTDFKYISIVAINDQGYISQVTLDAVLVYK
jgi:hypothetical protein